jgi:CBS domain-containing protein
LEDAAKIMIKQGISGLPVVEQPIRVISKFDIGRVGL